MKIKVSLLLIRGMMTILFQTKARVKNDGPDIKH